MASRREQLAALAIDLDRACGHVPVVGVARDDGQRRAWSSAANQQRHATLAKVVANQVNAVLQSPPPLSDRREGNSRGGVLRGVPAQPQAKHEPSLAEVVQA